MHTHAATTYVCAHISIHRIATHAHSRQNRPSPHLVARIAAVGAVLLARELGDRLNRLLMMLVEVATSVGRIDFLLDEVDQGKVALPPLDANFRAATERALDAI